jgi:hypothetical protein
MLSDAFSGVLVEGMTFNLAARIPFATAGLLGTGTLQYLLHEDMTLSSEQPFGEEIAIFRVLQGSVQMLQSGNWVASNLPVTGLVGSRFGQGLSIALPGDVVFRGFVTTDSPDLQGNGQNGYFATPTTTKTLSPAPFFYLIPDRVYRYGNVEETLSGEKGIVYFVLWVDFPTRFLSSPQWIVNADEILNTFSDPSFAVSGYWFGTTVPCGGCPSSQSCLRNDSIPFLSPTYPFRCQDPNDYHKGGTGLPGRQGAPGFVGAPGAVGPRGELGPTGTSLEPINSWISSSAWVVIIVVVCVFFFTVYFIAYHLTNISTIASRSGKPRPLTGSQPPPLGL